ncbi:hypothetical protein CHS0354_016160 [Potamilus streckersoni]|uniref:G-protein coupled receptors family 1 profile domain-containing protein n=1 Tax=Potamilus streckersoni TaxID=2493646 RepID=A0AAE0RXG3_9BIVA|nr:hypothetical protein CHS0354_016160 [Potamilus streckersoni]
MAHTDNNFQGLNGSNISPDNHTSGISVSEDSTVNGFQENRDLHLNNFFDTFDEDSNSVIYEGYYSEFSYVLFDFENKIYIYVWTVLVILTAFANTLIVAIFVRKNMRTTTNLILLFIAISDALTGVITLPTYIHVFTSVNQGWVSLSEGWCEALKISKFYISRAFHTVSIWQTLLLGFQRFFCVWFPFKTKFWFTTSRTLIAVAVITVFAFVIHTYHLTEKKADKIEGYCQWKFEDPCVKSCIFLWITLLLVNILPCVLLLILTILMIKKLFHRNILETSFSAEQSREREHQNKRASIIVVWIVIIFLIPEIPYGIFLLVTVIKMHSGEEILELRENRLFHFAYEIALLLSFQANFFVYIIMIRRFRDVLKSTFLDILRKVLPKRATVPIPTVSIEGSQTVSSLTTRGDDPTDLSTCPLMNPRLEIDINYYPKHMPLLITVGKIHRMQMAHINSSHENHELSAMHPDYDLSWTNSSKNSMVNGEQDNPHFNPNLSLDTYDDDSDSEYNYIEFFFKLHDFENNMYVCFWTFLVIIMAFANVIIVAVFVRKCMRTTTNLILLFISISDSLTGLVTLPTYIYVFTSGDLEWVGLNEGWCEAFMISKLYVSKAFHTVSIWQTLLLAFQRFVCVWFPFKTKSWFTTGRTLITVAVITIIAFVIHSYHLNVKKADKKEGLCRWTIENPCVESCAFLWITLLLVHIFPCVILLVLTVLMIQKLFHRNIQKESNSAEQSRERNQQNKRASIIVVCIAIIFLIPEIPYGVFLLVTVLKSHSGPEILPLRENRIFHLIYEIALLLSFHANFWVYITMNRRFREELKSMFLDRMRKILPKRATVTLATVSMETSQNLSHNTKGTDVNKQSTSV